MMKFVRSTISELGKFVAQSSRTQRMFWQSLITATVFYLWSHKAKDLATEFDNSGMSSFALQIILFFSAFFVFVGILRTLIYIAEVYESELEKERSTKAHAHTLCDRSLVNEVELLERASDANNLTSTTQRSHESIQRLVQAAYQTFESAYGQVKRSDERVDFEVTFMTRSHIDGGITIAAAANKDGRSPRSLELRKSDPKIYDGSVTAQVYRATSPRVVIVSSTQTEWYKELYSEQKKRIKSSIVFPVLSPSNRLLGTFVVHCDKDGFFIPELEKYWGDLLEIFSKRVALEAVRIEQDSKSNQPAWVAPY